MKCFKVGGAVRDRLLGLAVHDCDWVVVGATPKEMEALGFRRVGKNFPVFLHPQTHEEYALARTERKQGQGYQGFQVQTTPAVTLEQDLQRRDLTINAMAENEAGELIDPYGGKSDLQNEILRHVSPAFVEDPLRVLRVARFAARLDFRVAPKTLTLMKSLSQSGELSALTPERVWKETARALEETYPERYFEVLKNCDAQKRLFPEILGDPSGLRCLRRAADQGLSLEQRFAALCAGTKAPWGETENELLEPIRRHYPLPRACLDMARLGCRHAKDFLYPPPPGAEIVLARLQAVDSRRRAPRFESLLEVCAVLEETEQASAKAKHSLAWWQAVAAADQRITAKDSRNKGLKGTALGKEILRRRQQAITLFLQEQAPPPGAPPPGGPSAKETPGLDRPLMK